MSDILDEIEEEVTSLEDDATEKDEEKTDVIILL